MRISDWSSDVCSSDLHGIALEDFPFTPSMGEDLLFFGRIHPHKGTADAIAAAKRVNRRLIIAGIVQDEAYFRHQIAPEVDGKRVIYHGRSEEHTSELQSLMRSSYAVFCLKKTN